MFHLHTLPALCSLVYLNVSAYKKEKDAFLMKKRVEGWSKHEKKRKTDISIHGIALGIKLVFVPHGDSGGRRCKQYIYQKRGI